MYDSVSYYQECCPLKSTTAIWRIMCVAVVLTFATFVVATMPFAILMLLLIAAGASTRFSKQIADTVAQWLENQRIASQPNAHQRGYIIQRLRQLPYENDVFATRDPREDKAFTVRNYLDERLVTVFLIEFTENSYIGPVATGHEYQRTEHSYRLAPKRAIIHYEKSIGRLRNGSSEYRTRETARLKLDHLPDDVIENIEHALLNWEQVPAV